MKKVIIPLVILIVICIGLGIFGFYLNKNKKEEIKNINIKYKYYINGKKVENLPGEDEGYQFDEYKCTNGVTGKWSEKKWEFKTKGDKSSTCKLYFVDREYEVEMIAPEGITISGDTLLKVKKEENAEFVMAVKEGISIKEVACTNDQTTKIEEDKITVENVTDDTQCTIATEDAEYTVEAATIGGKVTNSKQQVKFGQNVVFKVTPNASKILDSVSCTNGQNGTYSNGNLIITKVTNNTKCTVTFKSNQYTVTVTAKNATVTPKTKTVAMNGTVTFSVVPTNPKYVLSKNSCLNKGGHMNGTNSYEIKGVTSNINCTLEFGPKVIVD